MKKIYFSIFTIALAFTASAQLTLTQAFNEPAVGNIHNKKGYDSTTVIPKATGAGQSWNFTSLVSNTVTEVSTYTTSASTPSAASFPLAPIAEGDGTGAFNYYRSIGANFEFWGIDDGAGSIISFTNPAVVAAFPINFGYSGSDTYSGLVTVATTTGNVSGFVQTNATGTGTVTLPGSIIFTNCLQLRSVNTVTVIVGTFPSSFTVNTVSTEYSYYTGAQKFPILSVNYEREIASTILGPTVTVTSKVLVNNAVLTGITDLNFDALNYNVYPNPATDAVNINLTNDKTEAVSVIVMNNLGQVVKSIELGSAIEVKYLMNTSDLASGIYHVKTSVGERSSTKKLIIQ
jgi:hypothetical protein